MTDLWGFHLYLYTGSLRVDGHEQQFTDGQISLTPPNAHLEWSFPDHAPHYFAHMRFPSGAVQDEVPILLGPVAWIEEAVAALEFVGNSYQRAPAAARARLWATIWRAVSEESTSLVDGATQKTIPPTVHIAVSIVDQGLASPIRVPVLAQRVGVSHNHLIKLFRQAFGTTVTQYIRRRRCERAAFFLGNTSLSIKAIAREVGIPDLHHFNKTIRQEFGVSPRALREQLVANRTPMG